MAGVLLFVALPACTRRIGWRRSLAFGVVVALSALVRPISLAFLPVLFVVLLVARFGWRIAVRSVAIVAFAVVVVLVPWTIRNIRVTHSLVLISTNLGGKVCMSRYVGATGAFQLDPACTSEPGD